MLRSTFLLLILTVPQAGPLTSSPATAPTETPGYTADGQLKFPAEYREWVFLTSGIDVSYSPQPAAASHSMFDNVFVNPSAYRAFRQTGTWPDRTMIVLESRRAEGNNSINKRGHTNRPRSWGSRCTSRMPRAKADGASTPSIMRSARS